MEKTALVTGANRGIGLEVARELAQRGFQVFLGIRNPDDGKKTEATLQKQNLAAHYVPLDVLDPTSIEKAHAVVAQKADQLDVLVNNAGVLLDDGGAITHLSPDTFHQTLDVNTLGPLLVTQHFLDLLKKSRSPRVINVSSNAGSLSSMSTYAPAYSISKTALNAVTRQLAAGLPGISVNSVCPGWVRTDMGGMGAPRSVEEGAETIVWLATDASSKITGQFLRDKKPAAW